MKRYSLLISLPTKGFLWFLLLFALCFFCVHIFKLALIGATRLRENPQPTPTANKENTSEKQEKKAPAAEQQEPIYYIVERKKRRAKSSYSEPKEIRFK